MEGNVAGQNVPSTQNKQRWPGSLTLAFKVTAYALGSLIGVLMGFGIITVLTSSGDRAGSSISGSTPSMGDRVQQTSTTSTSLPRAVADNPITRENKLSGSNKWQLGLQGYQIADDAAQQIAGYASATSVNKNEEISFYITVTPVQTYTIDIFRVGWYDGRGGRRMQHVDAHQGTHQQDCPVDATSGMIACDWAPSYTLKVPNDWTSGIYLVVLTNAQKYQNHIIFVVRDDERKADFLFQQSVSTYQAYNNYPKMDQVGKSLYTFNSKGPATVADEARAVKVSFDRPYNYGSGQLMNWEINFVRWLERSGYDVAYSTNLDTHTHGERLLNYKGFLSVGHDEYWSKEMYDAVEKARDGGVNLGFFGADAVYWQVRFEPSPKGVPNRVMVCYKDSNIDPVKGITASVLWRAPEVDRPEQRLMGVQYTSQITDTDRLTNNAPYVVTNSDHWVYQGTGFKDGDTVPNLVGYESDRYMQNYPLPANKSFTLLAKSPFINTLNKPDYSNAAIYQALSGAWVFSAGTTSWSWALDDYNDHKATDERIQKTTANILNTFVGTP